MDPAVDSGESWQTLLAQGRAGEALALYRLGELSGDTLEVLRVLASVRTDLREKAYARALRRLPTLGPSPDVTLNPAQLERDLTRLKEAAALLDKRRPDEAAQLLSEPLHPLLDAETDTLRGTLRVLNNDVEAAHTLFEAALAHDPRHYRALTNLGNLALEAGNTDEAVEHYEAALKLNEDFANAHHNLGVAYRRQGKLNKSVRSLRKAQAATHKRLRAEARDTLREKTGQGVAGLFGGKYSRWLLYAAAFLGIYLLLRAGGIL